MTAVKLDRRFKKRFGLRSVLLLLPALAAFLIIWRSSTQSGSIPWLAVGFFVAWIVAWIAADTNMWRNYRCPDCGQRIKSPTIPVRNYGDPIHYYCDKCDIEWATGLREATGD